MVSPDTQHSPDQKSNQASQGSTLPTQRVPLITAFCHYNSIHNLSAIREPIDIYHKHIRDACMISEMLAILPTNLQRTNTRIVDVGTGGGFPLLPLALLYPGSHFCGIDSVRKKVTSVQSIADTLGLTNVSTHWTRIEDHTITYPRIIARAVKHVNTLLPRLSNCVTKDSHIVLYKRFNTEEDQILRHHPGYTLVTDYTYRLFPDDEQRVLYCLRPRR